MPQVSIVVACYNAQPYLADAMQSMIDQTFTDWELIVVNDGSTDGSGEYLHRLAESDDRVRVIDQPNRGQHAAANLGISKAKSPLIARMDADDVSSPDRLRRQVDYLRTHPDVGLLGGQIRRLGEKRSGMASNFPLRHDAIVEMLLQNHHAICNPSIMFRKALFDSIDGYWQHDIAEDWDMFLRMADVSRLANLAEVIVSYRFHETSINGRRIFEAQLYNEYAACLAKLRTASLPAISFEQFERTHRSNHWPSSWLFTLDSHSIGQYRRAVAEIYGGRSIVGYPRLAMSMLMSPGRTLRRAGNMMRRGSGQTRSEHETPRR